MRTYDWSELSKGQQTKARAILAELGEAGVQTTVSQVAKYFDTAMNFTNGSISAQRYAELTGAEYTAPEVEITTGIELTVPITEDIADALRLYCAAHHPGDPTAAVHDLLVRALVREGMMLDPAGPPSPGVIL
jgi:hypothetical protein